MKRADLVAVAVALAFAFWLQCRKVLDVDVFWQIRAGQVWLDGGRLGGGDAFTYTHGGEPVPAVGWLAQGAFAAAYGSGGWGLVRAINAVVFAGAFAVAGLSAARRGASAFGVGTAMAMGFVVGVSNGDVRPQSFGLLGLAALLALARGGLSTGAKVAWSLAVAVAWQNAHPSLAVGVVALAALAAAGWAKWLGDRARPKPWDLSALVVLVALAQFATPMGVGVLGTMRDNATVARDWVREREWLPPWDPRVRAGVAVFWGVLGVALVTLAKVGRRVRGADLALFLAMTALALGAARFAVFWGVALVPVWAPWVDLIRPPGLFAWDGAAGCPRGVAVGVMGAGAVLAFGAPAVVGGPALGDLVPVEGVRRLAEVLPAGRVYNFREWGGPLILAGHPRWRVAVDGRLYLFRDRGEWREYADAAEGLVPLDALTRRHRPDAFFLSPAMQPGLAALLRASGGWREVYRDDRCDVFVRARRAGGLPTP